MGRSGTRRRRTSGPQESPSPTTALGEGILTRMATPGTPLSFSDVLRLRPVRRLWIAQIVSVFRGFLAGFAILAVVTFKLHGTATQVAMVLVSFMAPLAIVSPLAGVFVDRWDLKRP